MSMFESLLGGGQPKEQFQDFVQRYEQGAPADGIDDQETAARYDQVAQHLSPEEYQQSAQEAVSRMSPEERMQLGQQLQQHASSQGINLPGMPGDEQQLQQPNVLASLLGGMHQQQPGMLSSLLGGGGGGGGGGGLGGALGGMLGGGGGGGGLGGMLGGGGGMGGGGNPLMRAALGGIAAMAAKRMMG